MTLPEENLCSVLTGYDCAVESESILSLSDAAGGLVILLAFLSSFMFIAKKMLVSVTPVILVTSGFFIVGMFLYLPVSPFYIPSDASYYQAWGYSLSDYWAGEGPMVDRQIWPGKGFWPLIIAALHFFLGPIYVAAIAFNSGVFGLMILALQKSILLLSSKSGSWVLGFLVATSTPFALFGPSLLRESLFWLGASGGVLGISYLARREVRNGLLSLSWAVFLLLAIRPDAGVVIAYSFVGAAIVLFGLAGPFQSKRKKILSALALTGLLVSFPPASSFLIPINDPASVEAAASNLSTPDITTRFLPFPGDGPGLVSDDGPGLVSDDGPGLLSNDGCESFLALTVLCKSLGHLPNALFGPFYWEYGSGAIWWISGMSTLHFLSVSGLALTYVVSREGRGWISLGVLGVALVSFLMFSSIMTNYGILIRFRAATEVILTPLAISGYFVISSEWKKFLSNRTKS